ncbi:MAG: iron-sulfur cluster assembly protein [Chloroflexota bacterium]
MSEETKTEENATPSTPVNPEDVTEESVRDALRAVIDPELHLDVVALGLVETIDLEKTPAEIKMLLTTPFCPYGPWLVQQVKENAEKAMGREAKVEVLPKEWRPEMMEDPTLLGFF